MIQISKKQDANCVPYDIVYRIFKFI